MGFRFRRSVRLLPGIRLNFGTRGVSTSVGGRGFTLNFSKRGVRSTVGLPGTGISYSEMLTRNADAHSSPPPATPVGSSFGWGTLVFILVAVVALTKLVGGSDPGPDAAAAVEVPSTVAEPSHPVAIVSARVLKCRAAPTTKARVVARLEQGTAVQTLEQQATWTRVRDAGFTGNAEAGNAGGCWVASRFLQDR